MDIKEIRTKAFEFNDILNQKKTELAELSFWYPYGTLNNFVHLDALLTGTNRLLLDLVGGQPVADIGGADGDLAFFMETLGVEAHLIEHAPTNFNSLKGAKLLKSTLSSSVEIYETDLDAQFKLPQNTYGLIFLLGILYHLKNPFYILETIAKHTKWCLISTKIAQFSIDKKINFSDISIAYLLDAKECNNDASNYWVFSDKGLKRILKRTGWDICNYMTVGNTIDSDPATPQGDERAFCLARSRIFR